MQSSVSKWRRGVEIIGEAALLSVVAFAAFMTLGLAVAWYDAAVAAITLKTDAATQRSVSLTATFTGTTLTLVLSVLTYRYLMATRELVGSNKTLQLLAEAQEARTRPEFKLQSAEGVAATTDGRAYFHFDIVNEGWKDCAIRDCTVTPSGATESVVLELIKRNRQSPTPIGEGMLHQPLAWIPEGDFVVRAGDRRQFSGRATVAIDATDPATATLRVRGVLPTEDSMAINWRKSRKTELPAKPG